MHKRLFIWALLSLSLLYAGMHGHPIDDDEDDEDIIKHFEGLLKGSANDSNPKPSANDDDQIVDEMLPPEATKEEPNIVEKEDSDYTKNSNPNVSNQQPNCECKKYFECNVAGDKDNSNNDPGKSQDLLEVDVRWGDSIHTTCSHYFDICCNNVRDNTTEIRNPQYQHNTCGQRNLDGVGFRVKGAVNQESQFGEFPWMAAIVSQERQEGRAPVNVFVCGGSLIHPGVVLTAAHCVHKRSAQELVVRLGEWDTQTNDEIYPHKDHFVVKVVIHENFYAGALHNDVALLFLKEETKISPHIDTICLPPANLVFDGQRCFASGWGKTEFGQEGQYQVILKKLDLPIVSRDSCEYALKQTRLGRYFRLHDSFVCAGGEKGKDTCRGDGGSPLVCKVPGSDSYVQYGIVAWGIGCGDEGIPGVYVNIPKFVSWITRIMGEARLNTNYFKLGKKVM